jgi:hypothetical protein
MSVKFHAPALPLLSLFIPIKTAKNALSTEGLLILQEFWTL